MGRFVALFVIAMVALYLENPAGAVQVVFDNADDLSRVGVMTCEYSADYHDFWVYGCERSPSEDADPERSGFWTGCARDCELTYYGGLLPKPAKLFVETYFEGYNYISISGKNDPTDPDFQHDFGWIDSQEQEWCYREIDLAESEGDVSVIHFNISSSGSTGFVLIDKIIVDLGDKEIEPITIESKADELPAHWSYDDCHHLEEYADFWSFGCPVEPVEANPENTIGFWTPCTLGSCKIEFETSPSIIPTSVNIRGYLEDLAQIKVVVPKASGLNSEQFTVLETISAKAVGGWIDIDVDLSSHQAYKIDVVLESNGGTAMLDSISYSFDSTKHSDNRQSDLPMCIQKQATTTTEGTTITTQTTPGPTGTTVPTGTVPTGTVPTGTVPTGTVPTGTVPTAPEESTPIPTQKPTPTATRATPTTPETTTPSTPAPTTDSAGNSVVFHFIAFFPLLISIFRTLQ